MHSACRWASKQKKVKPKSSAGSKPASTASDKSAPAGGTPASPARTPSSKDRRIRGFAKPSPPALPAVRQISSPSKPLEERKGGSAKKAAQQLYSSEQRHWSHDAISILYRTGDLIWIESAGPGTQVWPSASLLQPPSRTMNSSNWHVHGA